MITPSERLRELRNSIHISQAKLAKLAGTTQASVNRYENDAVAPPVKILLWYADFFDVSMDYIFGRTNQPEGKLYQHQPKLIETMCKENGELKEFVDMCFDPVSPVSKQLKNILLHQLQESREK